MMKCKWIIAAGIAAVMAAVTPGTVFADDVTDLYDVALGYLNRDDDAEYEFRTATVLEDGSGVYLSFDDLEPYDSANAGGTVEVLAESGGWSLITTDGGVAYMHTDSLSRAYTKDDLDVLAHVICGEAQCYPDEEQLYVGSVVLNRVADARYPDTIRGVVFQRGQYACTWDGNYNRTPTARNWENARRLLEHGSILPVYVVYQSGARQGRGVYVHTKRHYYCY